MGDGGREGGDIFPPVADVIIDILDQPIRRFCLITAAADYINDPRAWSDGSKKKFASIPSPPSVPRLIDVDLTPKHRRRALSRGDRSAGRRRAGVPTRPELLTTGEFLDQAKLCKPIPTLKIDNNDLSEDAQILVTVQVGPRANGRERESSRRCNASPPPCPATCATCNAGEEGRGET